TGYTGHVMDQGTGLTYMQQRYYDPQIGRFVSVDPVSTEMYSGDNFGRYKYSNDSPYVFSDPDGRREKPLNGPLGISRHVRLGSATLAYSKDSNGIDQPNRDAYNCISFTWHDSQGDPGDPANDDVFPRMDNSIVNDVMKARAEGKKLAPDEPNRPGDRVVYGTDSNGNGQLDDSELDAADIHTATVSVVDAEGNTEVVTSKEGDKEIVDHHPSDQHPSYGKFKEWYRE
ncbi:RHS repeat-associated core domain-containing protein, partial [Arenimonas oryziterrae]